MRKVIAACVAVVLAGCAGMMVRQSDLDAWVNMPVEALDTHSLFITIPMYRTKTESGIEIRNYANGAESSSCFSNASASVGGKYVNASQFTNCTTNKVVCNNIFYIKEGRVVEYAPTGRCYTDDTVRPQARYLNLRK